MEKKTMDASRVLLRKALVDPDLPILQELNEQPAEVKAKVEELGRLRGWVPIEAWKKAKEAARICGMSSTIDGLEFALEAARHELAQKE